MNGSRILRREDWRSAGDGFSLCRLPLSALLHRMGIRDSALVKEQIALHRAEETKENLLWSNTH